MKPLRAGAVCPGGVRVVRYPRPHWGIAAHAPRRSAGMGGVRVAISPATAPLFGVWGLPLYLTFGMGPALAPGSGGGATARDPALPPAANPSSAGA